MRVANAKWTVKSAKRRLKELGLTIVSNAQIPYGRQLRTREGPIVAVYHNGNVLVQGKRLELLRGSFG